MAFSGLDIYKLLPKTNCKECGFSTCLAFAMQLAKKAVAVDKCPYLSEDAKRVLAESSQPSIKLVTIGEGEGKFAIGNETVMFRHEEKFHQPCGIGFIIDDSAADAQIKAKIQKINQLHFERVGTQLSVNLIAVSAGKDAKRFVDVVKMVAEQSRLGLVLMSEDVGSLEEALKITHPRKPLLYHATKENGTQVAALAKQYSVALVATAADLESMQALTKELSAGGVSELVLDTTKKSISDKIWDLTQIRRQALKKSNRALGYPTLVIVENDDPFEEAIEAATFIAKYAGIVLMKNVESYLALALLTARQNIYTDPQKPLQIEPKLYAVGQVSEKSPVLVTTNFSLTYYTVLGEVEASKVPSYIVSVDTEGMSVLTAWAAEKFTPERITNSLNKFGVPNTVAHKRLVIPGYVAVMSGELEETSGWHVVVGPKEAASIPSFLKNL